MANSQRGRIHKKKPPHLHLSPQMQMYMQIQTQRKILTSSLFSIHSVPSENTLLKIESVCVCVCSMICVHERVSNPSVGQRLYTEPWEFGGGPPALTLSLRAPSCNQGHIDQLPWPAAFPPHISLINRCDVHPVVSSPLTHTKHTHTAHAKSNNFQLLVGYRLQGGQA